MTNKLSFKQSLTAWLWAAITAILANSILFFIYHSAGIITDTVVVQPGTPLTVIPVIITSLIPVLIAIVVFFLLEKYTRKGYKIFTIVSIVLLILSFLNPFLGIPGVPVPFALALITIHVVVAAALLYFIKRSIKQNIVHHMEVSYSIYPYVR